MMSNVRSSPRTSKRIRSQPKRYYPESPPKNLKILKIKN